METHTTTLHRNFFDLISNFQIIRLLLASLLLTLFTANIVTAQNTAAVPSDSILITVFLKHLQDKNLETLRKIQTENKLWDKFTPKSATVVSWYVMMGLGQVVTLRIPTSELRILNPAIEKGAWGAFETEFYPTYDFEPILKENYDTKPSNYS